jgi:hypothetical protein
MLESVETFSRTTSEERADLATRIAAALGADWRSAGVLRGKQQLATVLHVPTNLELVAIPGGSFVAGIRPDEVELMRTVEYVENTALEWIDKLAEAAVPREVTVKPFLCARAPASAACARVLGVDVGWVVGDDSDDAPIRLDDESAEALFEQFAMARLPRRAEWEWVARQGGALPFINGATFEEAEDACKALYGTAFDPVRDDAGQNAWGVWGMPWGDWICEDDELQLAYAGRGGAAMLYPWQGDEIVMQLAGQPDDTCGFDEQCVRFVVNLPAL